MERDDIFAGVELGGTKCVAILAHGPDSVVERETVPTTTPEETIGRLAQILGGWKATALGIASFGPLDLEAGKMAATPKPGWAGIDILGPLQAAAGVPAAIDTDVNAAALAEMRWGAGQGMAHFAYITVGTGVGVGLVVGGTPVRGFTHGELGHIRVARLKDDEFAGSCPFHGDCVEGLAAGPSLKARGVDVATLKARGVDVATLKADDPVWDSVSSALAQLCHVIVCAAAPRAIVIGGGVVGNQSHLLERIEAMLVESLAGYVELPPGGAYVRAPGLGDNAGPLGAIALAMSVRR
ncbi:MAG: ROK family protein [Pseudomonadota bacterium]